MQQKVIFSILLAISGLIMLFTFGEIKQGQGQGVDDNNPIALTMVNADWLPKGGSTSNTASVTVSLYNTPTETGSGHVKFTLEHATEWFGYTINRGSQNEPDLS